MDILTAITTRHACRAFLDKPVPTELTKQVLDAAKWAPSGVNTQPWQVHVLTGAAKMRLSEALINARKHNLQPNPDYAYYPEHWTPPFKDRRRECGLKLYSVLGIDKGDADGQMRAWNNNYTFFGAPIGLIFTFDKTLQTGSWLDMGMFLQNVMLGALEFELATCPQASLIDYPDLIRSQLGLDEEQLVICGMSLGYPDLNNPVNQYRLPREPASAFTHWYNA